MGGRTHAVEEKYKDPPVRPTLERGKSAGAKQKPPFATISSIELDSISIKAVLLRTLQLQPSPKPTSAMKLLISLLLASTAFAVNHKIQCFSEENCQGDAGAVREFESNDIICVETKGRKSCYFTDGFDNNLAGRIIGGTQCGACTYWVPT